MYGLDNYRYPYHATIYPPFCFCLGLTIMVAGLTISAFYQTMAHMDIFTIYGCLCIFIGTLTHLQYYTDYTPEVDIESDGGE